MNLHPANNPNAYVAGLSGAIVDILLYELKKRFGLNLDGSETSFIATAIPALLLLAGSKLGKQVPPA